MSKAKNKGIEKMEEDSENVLCPDKHDNENSPQLTMEDLYKNKGF